MSVDPTWSKHDDDQPSYVWAMLTHPININTGLLTLLGATFLSIPFGLPGVLLPLLAFGAGEAIASVFLPSSALFRSNVDAKFRKERRERAVMHLRSEIERRVGADHPHWQTWQRMFERVQSLREMARHRRSTLTERDIERVEDSGLDFLGLWLAELSMLERRDAVKERVIEQRIADLGKRIDENPADSRSLRKARSDLEELLLRHRRVASRLVAVEAALLSLPDAVEEIYNAVITTPVSGEGGVRLQEAIERLRLEEELESSYGDEVREHLPSAVVRVPAANRQAVSQ